MSKKVGLIVAGVCVAVGAAVIGGALVSVNGDFAKHGTSSFQTKEYEITKEFTNISIDTVTADIHFMLSNDGKTKVVCFERESMSHSVSVDAGTLKIVGMDERKWYEYIGIFGEDTITVYLPEVEYGALTVKADTSDVDIPAPFRFTGLDISVSTGDIDCDASVLGGVKIKTTTGDIELERMSAGSIELAVSTGEIHLEEVTSAGELKFTVTTGEAELENVTCKTLYTKGSTGDIELKRVSVAETMTIVRSTGDVRLDRCDGAELSIRTRTGDIRGTLLTDKTFSYHTETGRVQIPKDTSGGRCELTTTTGDIRIEIVNR